VNGAAAVSCLVPAYNAAKFIGEALDSIIAQTHPPFEVIVVDDGSDDDTREVIRQYGRGVQLIETAHAGYPHARDVAIAAARGEFIAFLDADDLWVADKTARQLDVLRAQPTIDLCVGHYLNFWDAEVAAEAEAYRDHPLSRPVSGYIVPTLLARRDSLERFGPFATGPDPSDTSWFVRALSSGARLCTLPDVLLRRRLHRGNYSRSADPLKEIFKLISARRRGRA
jgi:glycosyltransferase involved in cell wall biosynthesis